DLARSLGRCTGTNHLLGIVGVVVRVPKALETDKLGCGLSTLCTYGRLERVARDSFRYPCFDERQHNSNVFCCIFCATRIVLVQPCCLLLSCTSCRTDKSGNWRLSP
ncbi:unnamed protein product, partial [Ectocarpus sp. 4 AP-2014]